MVNLEWYRTFKAIYKQGSMTKAAQDLRISQPNISVHLAALENHVGGKLFDRVSRGLIPTDLGKHLYTQITEAIEKLEYVELNYKGLSSKIESTIRLGTPYEYFYSEICSKMQKLESRLVVEFGIAPDLLNQLDKGDLDFVIATKKVQNKNITYDHIFQESFIVVGNPSVDLSSFNKYVEKRDLLNMENWLLSKDWFAYSNDLAFIRRFWIVNFNKRPSMTPRYIIPDLNYIIKSICFTDGISIVSEYLAKEYIDNENLICLWNGITPTTNDLYIAYNKNKVSNSKVEEMRRLVLSN